jgi:3-hydroxyacyl-[acyl-carrier-protein] dehydratase
MMLIGNLYKIISRDQKEGVINVILEIDTHHSIFEGHFPGQPVLPGAIMLQMIKDVLESSLKYPIRLKKVDQIKFLGLIDPQINNLLQLSLSYNQDHSGFLSVIASLVFQNNTSLKFKGSFIKL